MSEGFTAGGPVRQLYPLTQSGENDGVIPNNISTTHRVHADLCPGTLLGDPRATISYNLFELLAPNLSNIFSQRFSRATWRVSFEAMVHLDNFNVKLRSQNLGGLARQPEQSINPGGKIR